MKLTHIIYLLLICIISFPIKAKDNTINGNSNPENSTYTIEIIRGKTISLTDLSAIADIATARDQKGNKVTLESDEFEIASFTNTTITVIPPGGNVDDVITIDLKPK